MSENLHLPDIPISPMFIGDDRIMTVEWQEFFRILADRVGGVSASTLNETHISTVSELYSTPENFNKIIDDLHKLMYTSTPKEYNKIIDDLHKLMYTSTPKNFNNTRNRTTRITNADSPYAVLLIDEVIFCDTDGGAIEIDLIAGMEGKHYKAINSGSSGNDLTIDPFGIEEIFGGGAGVARILMDGDVLDMHYEATEGWW